MTSFGRRLRQERDRLGLSQEQFGELGGVKRSSQHLYEHDVRRPDADYLAKIHGAGADVGFLLTGRASASSAGEPMLSVSEALAAFRAVADFVRSQGDDVVSHDERQRLFEFLCRSVAAEPNAAGVGELQVRLARRWAS